MMKFEEKSRPFVLFYAWGTCNPGDHALTLGALYWLTSIVDQADITVVTRYGASETAETTFDPTTELLRVFPSIKVIPGPFAFSRRTAFQRILQIVQGAILVGFCLLMPRLSITLLGKGQAHALRELSSARFVFLNGGNLFYWNSTRKNLSRLMAFAFPLIMAYRLGIPYGMLPQTSGPCIGPIGRRLGWIFGRARFVLFRDSDSQRNVEAICELQSARRMVSPDLAFHMKKVADLVGTHPNLKDLPPKEYVPVVLRVEPLGPDVSKSHDDPFVTLKLIEELFPPALKLLQDRAGKKIVLVVQVASDREVTLLVQKRLRELHQLEAPVLSFSDPEDYSRLYSNASFIISMRLHSLIFAFTQGTPGLAVWRPELGRKIPSMMSDLGLDEYCFELRRSSASQLVDSSEKLIASRERIRSETDALLQARIAEATDFLRPFCQGNGTE